VDIFENIFDTALMQLMTNETYKNMRSRKFEKLLVFYVFALELEMVKSHSLRNPAVRSILFGDYH
jgi:hypothetical protein